MSSKQLVLSLLIFAWSSNLFADFIFDNSGFSPNSIIESFEGITPGPSLLINNSNLPLLLPSGARIVGPATNNWDTFVPFIVNGGFFGLPPGSPFIPAGVSYVGQANPGLRDDGIVFQFPNGTIRVGAFVGIGDDSSVNAALTIEAYDKFDSLLGALPNVTGSGVNSEWSQNFVGFESDTPIDRLVYRGSGAGVLRIDLLQFEVIPEPSSFCLLLLPTISTVLQARHHRRVV